MESFYFSLSNSQTKLATTTEDLRERLFGSGARQKLVFHHRPPSEAMLTNAEHHFLTQVEPFYFSLPSFQQACYILLLPPQICSRGSFA